MNQRLRNRSDHPQAQILLPFGDTKEQEAAARFVNKLIETGTSLFVATVEDGEMLIEFNGGY